MNLSNNPFVFVYGSLKSGFGNHSLLEESVFVGNALTKDSAFTMISFGAFPGVMLHGNKRVKGEVYRVNDYTMFMLDKLEGNGFFYTRHIQDFLLEDGTEIKAWIYLLPASRRYLEEEACVRVEMKNDCFNWLPRV